jgi:hypothetical protein
MLSLTSRAEARTNQKFTTSRVLREVQYDGLCSVRPFPRETCPAAIRKQCLIHRSWVCAYASSIVRIYVMFKVSVLTSKKIQHVSVTKINWLMLFTEIIAVYSDNNTKHVSTLRGKNAVLLITKTGGIYKCHEVLEG